MADNTPYGAKRDAAPEVSLQAAHVRVPQETEPLLKGLIGNAVILILALGATLPFALNPKTATVGWVLFGAAMLWVFAPYCWLLARMNRLISSWKQLAASGSVSVPESRQHPQMMVNDICRHVPLATIPTVVITPGGDPALMSAGNAIYLTEALYAQTNDRQLHWLLMHEVGHVFAGHLPLAPLAAGVATTEIEGALRILILPILPLVLALEEWAHWADVTADRLTLVINPDLNLATMGVLLQVVITFPMGEIRARITRFIAAEGQVDPGEEVGFNQAYNDLLFIRNDAATRIKNLHEWRDHAAYRAARELVRARLGALPTPSAAPARPGAGIGTRTLNPSSAHAGPAPAAAPVEGGHPMPLQRLAEMGLALPAPPEPLGIYLPVVRTGNLLYLCGQLPLVAGTLPAEYTGKVGASVSLERAQLAARQAALNCLSIVHDAVGLSRVKQIVRVTGYVSSAATFTDQPVALNGASELLAGVFGDAGTHARVAVGVAVLPKDACIEVDMIVEVA